MLHLVLQVHCLSLTHL
jgi:hypothetical protein